MSVGIILGDKMVVFRLLFLILCSANGILALIFSFGTQTPAVPAPNTFNQNCRDKLNNCYAFEQSSCRPPYEQWARDNCPNHCGFCMGPTTPAPPCVDKIPGCQSYEKAVCSNPDYRTWVNENCRLFCRRCPPAVLAVIDALTTVIPPDQCYDRVDCRVYGTNACTGNYRQWAQVNCPNHCGFCVGLPTPPPICRDRIPNCNTYNPDACTNPDFKLWAEDNCKKFCHICVSGSTIAFVPPSPPAPGKKRAVTLKPFECKDKLPNCHEFDDGSLCTAPTYYNWARENCYKYCKFPPCGITLKPFECKDKLPNCHEFDDGSLCTAPTYYNWARENCYKYCKFPPCGMTLKPLECKNKLDSCHEFDDGTLCTAPSYYNWARENCYKYCKFPPCGTHEKRQFVASHHHHGDYEKCWDFKGELNSTSDICTTMVPTQNPATITTAGPGQTTEEFNASQFKPNHKPPPDWDKKASTAAPETTTPKTATVDHTNDVASGQPTNGPDGITPTGVSEPTGSTPSIVTGSPVSGTASTNSPMTAVTNSPATASTDSPVTSQTNSPMTASTSSPMTAVTDSPVSTGSPMTPNSPSATMTSTATSSASHGQSSVPSAPTSVQCGITTDSTIRLSWQPPTFPNGVVQNYMIGIYSYHGLTHLRDVSTMTAATEYMVDGLSPGSYYIFRVYAVNERYTSTDYASDVSGSCQTRASTEASTRTTASTEAPITISQRVPPHKTTSTPPSSSTSPATPSVSSTTKVTNTIKTPPPLNKTSSTAGTPPPFNHSSSTQRTPPLNPGTHGIPPTPSPTSFTEPTIVTTAKPCVDSRDCTKFSAELCTLPVYRSFAEGNCPAFCKFCIPVTLKPFECKDKLANCHEYEDGTICTSTGYYNWAKENCYKYCRFPPCGNNTVHEITTPAATTKPPTTTEDPSGCRDLSDTCIYYADEKCCGIYAPWAKSHCAKRCGYCGTLACVDEESHCAKFPAEICTADSYRGWARKNCRKFCNLCASSMPCANETTTPQTTYPWFNHVSDTGTTAELITPGEPVTSVKPTIKVTTPATDNIPMG